MSERETTGENTESTFPNFAGLALLLGCGTLVAAGACANACWGLDPQAETAQLVEALSLIALLSFPVGVGVGGQGWWLCRKHGARGGVVFALMIVLAVATAISCFALLHDIELDPADIGFVTTRWLYAEMGWEASIGFLFTVIIDLLIMLVAAVVGALALAVAPPASGVCCATTLFLIAIPPLAYVARKSRRPA